MPWWTRVGGGAAGLVGGSRDAWSLFLRCLGVNMGPWASRFLSLSLSFTVCKMEIVRVPVCKALVDKSLIGYAFGMDKQ